jgi:hypothetical protein
MPNGSSGEKRRADVIVNAAQCMRVAKAWISARSKAWASLFGWTHLPTGERLVGRAAAVLSGFGFRTRN